MLRLLKKYLSYCFLIACYFSGWRKKGKSGKLNGLMSMSLPPITFSVGGLDPSSTGSMGEMPPLLTCLDDVTISDEELGSGAFGTVYAGVSLRGSPLAIKVCRPKEAMKGKPVPDLAREAAIYQRVSNAVAGVPLFRGYVDGKLITRKASGVPLDRHLFKESKPLGLNRTKILIAFLRAYLAGLKRLSIVDRDLKPANLIFDRETFQFWKVDLGLAGDLSRGPLTSNCGTPGYQAPEVATKVPYDERADLYSFAATLFEAYTGFRARAHLDKTWSSLIIQRGKEFSDPEEEVRSLSEIVSAYCLPLPDREGVDSLFIVD
jgi:serine/threonine protein kinase